MTTTKTKAWLRAIGSMRFSDLAIANLEELHGMLHDLIHIDDVDALRAALRDRDLGEAVEGDAASLIVSAVVLERAAVAMWKHEAERAAPNVAAGRTHDVFLGQDGQTQNKWMGLAVAALSSVYAAPDAKP